MDLTLYWHDYETSGVDPRRDRPMQFAGIRTDEDLDEIDEPLMLYCRPAPDCLPHPEACLLTGILPQQALERGVCEAEFIGRIHEELARPGTCATGYNTLRFDDEVTRHTLYRNFYDPYAREWQNGNSRWDIIDLVRMCFALRPEGIDWPRDAAGRPSFRLERLTAANGIGHEGAHDALADVRATIALARLVRDRQPRLYDWYFRLRDKREAARLVDPDAPAIVVHTTRMYPAESGCTSLVWPLARDPENRNGVFVYDLRHDPRPFLDLDVEALRARWFRSRDALGDGDVRLPVKLVRLNRCPALAPLAVLDEASRRRLAIDPDRCEVHARLLADADGFVRRLVQAYGRPEGQETGPTDVDCALYDGFLSDADRRLCEAVRSRSPDALAGWRPGFADPRLPELLFRYRARNWPETLDEAERRRWREHCRARLLGADGYLSLETYEAAIADLRRDADTVVSERLDALAAWGRALAGEVGLA